MLQALTALAALTALLRTAFFYGGVALAAVATADWAARTRRLNPFGGVARFMRARVDPRLVGVERQVLRLGGRTAATPWWALVLYIVVAMLVLAALDMIRALVSQAVVASACRIPGRRSREPNSLSRDERYRAARRRPVPRRRV